MKTINLEYTSISPQAIIDELKDLHPNEEIKIIMWNGQFEIGIVSDFISHLKKLKEEEDIK